MNACKISLFFLTILFISIRAAENNNIASHTKQEIFIDALSNCREIGWAADGTIIVNANQNDIPAIFGIKTNDNYKIETLCIFASPQNAKANNSITLLDYQRAAFISLQDSSALYTSNGELKTYEIRTQHRPTTIPKNRFESNLIIMDYNPDWMVKSTSIFDGKILSPCENLNAAIKANDKPEYAFYNCITKSPSENTFSVICEEGIWEWKPTERQFTLIDPINDPTCIPLDFSTIVHELIYNCNGCLLAMTSEFCYSCFIYDKENKKLIVLQNEVDKEAVEKARKVYELNPTHENGRLLIHAGWKSQYPIDSKEFHPTIPYVIATFLRSKAEVTYWNAKTAKIIAKQILHQSMNQNNNVVIGNPSLRLISFDPFGNKIACAFNDGVVIVPVPQEILVLLNQQ